MVWFVKVVLYQHNFEIWISSLRQAYSRMSREQMPMSWRKAKCCLTAHSWFGFRAWKVWSLELQELVIACVKLLGDYVVEIPSGLVNKFTFNLLLNAGGLGCLCSLACWKLKPKRKGNVDYGKHRLIHVL